jgi:hypothetical protein
MNIKVDDTIEPDQSIVVGKLAEYFSTMADTLSHQHNNSSPTDSNQGIKAICKENKDKQLFHILPLCGGKKWRKPY